MLGGAARCCLVLAVIVVVVASGCGEDAGREGDAGPRSEAMDDGGSRPGAVVGVVPALCEARKQARTDRIAAGRTFFDRAHHLLHSLADDAGRADPRRARELLEAKAIVEADLSRQAPASRLRADLGRLLDAAGAALRALSMNPPPCRR